MVEVVLVVLVVIMVVVVAVEVVLVVMVVMVVVVVAVMLVVIVVAVAAVITAVVSIRDRNEKDCNYLAESFASFLDCLLAYKLNKRHDFLHDLLQIFNSLERVQRNTVLRERALRYTHTRTHAHEPTKAKRKIIESTRGFLRTRKD